MYGRVAAKDVDIKHESLVERMTTYYNNIPPLDSHQQGTAEWKEARRLRLTASNFGKVYKMRAKTSPKSTVENMLYPKFTGNAATAHGLREESNTEQMFIDYIKGKGASEISVHHPGLLLLPNEKVLGASPDGVFCCNPGTANIPASFVVEYKNPKKLVDAGMTVCEAVDTKVKDFPLSRDENNEFILKPSHPFYFQIQGVMAATQLTDAAFVIRGAHDSMAVVWVSFDSEFFYTNVISKLRKFYFQAILPELAHPLMSQSGARPYYVEWSYGQLVV